MAGRMKPPWRDHRIVVDDPELDDAGWWFEVHAAQRLRYGPFATESDCRAQREALFQQWNRSARRRGGWVWMSTRYHWCITLPEEADVVADLPILRSGVEG